MPTASSCDRTSSIPLLGTAEGPLRPHYRVSAGANERPFMVLRPGRRRANRAPATSTRPLRGARSTRSPSDATRPASTSSLGHQTNNAVQAGKGEEGESSADHRHQVAIAPTTGTVRANIHTQRDEPKDQPKPSLESGLFGILARHSCSIKRLQAMCLISGPVWSGEVAVSQRAINREAQAYHPQPPSQAKTPATTRHPTGPAPPLARPRSPQLVHTATRQNASHLPAARPHMATQRPTAAPPWRPQRAGLTKSPFANRPKSGLGRAFALLLEAFRRSWGATRDLHLNQSWLPAPQLWVRSRNTWKSAPSRCGRRWT